MVVPICRYAEPLTTCKVYGRVEGFDNINIRFVMKFLVILSYLNGSISEKVLDTFIELVK